MTEPGPIPLTSDAAGQVMGTSKSPKPGLLIISGVKPFPGEAGQQMRVRNKIVALRELFEITFLTIAGPGKVMSVEQELLTWVDRAIVLPSAYHRGWGVRLFHILCGFVYSLVTGLKRSNYLYDRVELSPRRIAAVCCPADYDLVLYEYWHTHRSVSLFQACKVPCALDMHDLLWQSRSRQLRLHSNPLLRWLRPWLVAAYRRREEAAWRRYDILIAISAGEAEYTRQACPGQPVLLAPMGIDIETWPFCAASASPPRVAYYGGLGNPHNQRDALRCLEQIMPLIWEQHPDVELWLVGSNPPPSFHELARSEPRLTVTGFVPQVQEVLKTMTAVLCPFTGTFGFRSRLIEVMALGVPVVATADAVHGMDLENGQGMLLAESDGEMAAVVGSLLTRPSWAGEQSRAARKQVQARLSFDATYGRLARELVELVRNLRKEDRLGHR